MPCPTHIHGGSLWLLPTHRALDEPAGIVGAVQRHLVLRDLPGRLRKTKATGKFEI